MTNVLTEVRKAVIRRLETITIANGYRTDLGLNVKTGWLNEVLDQTKVPPLFALLQKAPGKVPVRGTEGVINPAGFFVMGLAKANLSEYEDQLDDMELDLIQAFMPSPGILPKNFPKGVTGIELGAPEQFPPGKGQSHAGVLIPLHVKTVIEVKNR
ncbi:hypothetical protein [Pseudomonas sp. GV071]|uniref:hypothetical protein n=1 Tax=Pseudomonas sp. GV071 TaxID=2135754 RepID=UPI000D3A5DC8|nr:hypothetical protein [Pseudomonas sp. GV071]PTQ70356.1 hypothetical protein C8K61_10678 [Pseudomonas sp. GV071]